MVGVIYFLSDSINSKNEKIKQLNNDLSMQVAITADYEKRINSLHEIDAKHTMELTNAKAEIDRLRIDVINGTKRLRVKAECPSSENSSTSSVDASRPATLARDAEQDYFDLLKQLETLEKQYLGLRDYYFTECKR
ncbi:lysis protein [Providencia rettgeri]|uniref:Lysis protein n=3 Tax=Providencia rettgeri TaxID=587 RepID=A0AAP2JXP6_PRORE|nr:lysis protein [Providencia rettgeri]MBX6954721.1 lysis protein [Providencia rettgeri]MBX6959198.1 lysis protein [Providencia rettgeri]MBX6972119.1 lysis protein [Providencia rettgeri]MBX6980436.1 lysis protein [Providencia rettgeri]